MAKYYIPSGRCIQAIDYSHKDNNGNSKKVPDSLINKFFTKNGRVVYDGKGIKPDIVIEPEIMSNISYSLINKFLVFNYATDFAKKNDSIAPPDQFEITDEIYNNFTDYISDKDYD